MHKLENLYSQNETLYRIQSVGMRNQESLLVMQTKGVRSITNFSVVGLSETGSSLKRSLQTQFHYTMHYTFRDKSLPTL